jgi:hypothetical protein
MLSELMPCLIRDCDFCYFNFVEFLVIVGIDALFDKGLRLCTRRLFFKKYRLSELMPCLIRDCDHKKDPFLFFQKICRN